MGLIRISRCLLTGKMAGTSDVEPTTFISTSTLARASLCLPAAAGKVEAAVPILGGEVRIAEAPIPDCACDVSSSEADGAISGAMEAFSQKLKAWANRCMKDGVA